MSAFTLTCVFATVPALAEDFDSTDSGEVEADCGETSLHESGWFFEEDAFRYYDSDGMMLTDTWVEEDGVWYYVDADGEALSEEWLEYEDEWYYFDADREALSEEWLESEGEWYYFDADREALSKEWLTWGGKWYYFDEDRAALAGEWLSSDGTWYYFKSNCSLVINGWVSDGGAWYYCGSGGRLLYNSWVKYGGKWYYVGSNAKMLANQRIYYKGVYYYFNSTGACVTSSTSAKVGSLSAMKSACNRTPSTGAGGCAAWVTNVFKRAGIGTWNGSARDMYNMYCTSSNRSALKPGMIIAVSSCPGTSASVAYGHVGIYIGNGMVAHNLLGVVGTMSLNTWIARFGGYCTPKWGWLGGVVLY